MRHLHEITLRELHEIVSRQLPAPARAAAATADGSTFAIVRET